MNIHFGGLVAAARVSPLQTVAILQTMTLQHEIAAPRTTSSRRSRRKPARQVVARRNSLVIVKLENAA